MDIEDTTELTFLNRPILQNAVIRNLEVIGEASRKIEHHFPEFSALHPELPLAAAYQMRNALIHDYFKVDLEIVWKTVEKDLPELYEQVRALVQNLPHADIGLEENL